MILRRFALLFSLSLLGLTPVSDEERPKTGVEVWPMVVELSGSANDPLEPIPIHVESRINLPLRVTVTPMDATQTEDGTTQLTDAGTHSGSCADWLKPGLTSFVVNPKDQTTFPLVIHVPRRAAGRRLCSLDLFLEPQEPGASHSSARTNFRYSVLVKIHAQGPQLAPILVIDPPHVFGGAPYPKLSVRIQNSSLSSAQLAATAELRHTVSNQPTHVKLRFRRGRERVDTHELWPDGVALATGQSDAPLAPGAYTLHIRIIANKRVFLKETSVTLSGSVSRQLAWQEQIPVALSTPGKKALASFMLYNLSGDSIDALVTATPATPSLCQGWRLDMPTMTVSLPPHGRRRLTGHLTAPMTGLSTCVVRLSAQSGGDAVTTLVGGQLGKAKELPAVTILKAHGKSDAQTSRITFILKQDGPLPTAPLLTLFLTSKGQRVPLIHTTDDTPVMLFPGLEREWTLEIPQSITPGQYRARLVSFFNERSSIIGDIDMVVEPTP